jgi:hypothetical protein
VVVNQLALLVTVDLEAFLERRGLLTWRVHLLEVWVDVVDWDVATLWVADRLAVFLKLRHAGFLSFTLTVEEHLGIYNLACLLPAC